MYGRTTGTGVAHVKDTSLTLTGHAPDAVRAHATGTGVDFSLDRGWGGSAAGGDAGALIVAGCGDGALRLFDKRARGEEQVAVVAPAPKVSGSSSLNGDPLRGAPAPKVRHTRRGTAPLPRAAATPLLQRRTTDTPPMRHRRATDAPPTRPLPSAASPPPPR